MSQKSVVDDVKRIFPDVGSVAERLKDQSFEDLNESLAEGAPEDPIVESARRERERVVNDGIEGLAKVAEGREDELTPEEQFGLEAIILVEGRPAILVQDGDFMKPPTEWAVLAQHRDAIRDVISRVGRVEVNGHLDLEWLGTAFLVGPSSLMTNRHVAEEFSRRDGADKWTFRKGMTSCLDFREELGSTVPLEFEITEIIGIHPEHDMAVLRVDTQSRDGQSLPSPLRIASTEPADLADRSVYVVGYPAWDGRRNEPEPMRRIFMEIYNVKRLQPGQAVGFATQQAAFQHDCSTLGGNSGSPVLDLDEHRVIGLHFGGRYSVGNYAVPLWTLTQDPLLNAAEVNFN